jgi:hypothetical protein
MLTNASQLMTQGDMLVVHAMRMTKQNQDKLQAVLIDLSFNLPTLHNPHSFLFVYVITFVVQT